MVSLSKMTSTGSRDWKPLPDTVMLSPTVPLVGVMVTVART